MRAAIDVVAPPQSDLTTGDKPRSGHEMTGPPDDDHKPGRLSYSDARRRVLDDFERSYVTEILTEARGNVARAARLGQMDRTYLIKLIRRHGLSAG